MVMTIKNSQPGGITRDNSSSSVQILSSIPAQNQCSPRVLPADHKIPVSNTTQSGTSVSSFAGTESKQTHENWTTIYRIEDDHSDCVQPLVTSEIFNRRFSYRDHLSLEFPSKMAAVESMYSNVDRADNKNYFLRLVNCRSLAMFQRHEETGEVKVTSEHCGLRWCPLCAKSRQGRITNEVSGWFEHVRKPVLLTLTLKHTAAPLKHQVHFLYKDFKKLRNRKLFRKKSYGGIWFFHIKRSRSDGYWHPHLHCLMDSEWIDKKELSTLWSKITGGSYVVHLKTVENPHNSVGHAARYSAEPCDVSTMPESDALEVFYAMHGKRLCGTWGTGRTMDLRKPKDPECKKWKSIGDWNEVRSLIDTDPKAKAIWRAYALSQPLDDGITFVEPEPPVEYKKWIPPPRLYFQPSFNFSF